MRKPLVLVALASLASIVAACGYTTPPPTEPAFTGQSYPQAMQTICDVDRLAGIQADDDPLSIGRKRTEWVQQHVENPDGIYLRTLVSVKAASDQAVDLRNEAKEAGLARCALADDLEKTGMGGLSP